MPTCWRHPSTGGCAKRLLVTEWEGHAPVLMPPAYDLIIERGGAIEVQTIQARDEDAAWRVGLMLHIDALKAVVCRDEYDLH